MGAAISPSDVMSDTLLTSDTTVPCLDEGKILVVGGVLLRSPSSGGLSLACWSRPPFTEVPKCGWSDRCTLGLLLSKKTSSHTARYKSSGRDSGRDSRVTPFWQQAWGLPAGLSRDSRVEDSRIDPFWQQAWGLPAGSLRDSEGSSLTALHVNAPDALDVGVGQKSPSIA